MVQTIGQWELKCPTGFADTAILFILLSRGPRET